MLPPSMLRVCMVSHHTCSLVCLYFLYLMGLEPSCLRVVTVMNMMVPAQVGDTNYKPESSQWLQSVAVFIMCCTSAAMSRKIQLTVEYEFHNNNAEVFTLCRDLWSACSNLLCFCSLCSGTRLPGTFATWARPRGQQWVECVCVCVGGRN